MYTYSYGFESREDARHALDDLIAAGEVSEGEGPVVASYRNREGKRRWRILLNLR